MMPPTQSHASFQGSSPSDHSLLWMLAGEFREGFRVANQKLDRMESRLEAGASIFHVHDKRLTEVERQIAEKKDRSNLTLKSVSDHLKQVGEVWEWMTGALLWVPWLWAMRDPAAVKLAILAWLGS